MSCTSQWSGWKSLPMWVSDGGVGLQKERWRGKRLSCAHLQRFRLSPRTAPFGSGNCCSPPGLASAGSMAQPPRPVWLCCCCWSSCLPAPAPASGGVATLRCPALPLGSPQLGSPLRSMPCPLFRIFTVLSPCSGLGIFYKYASAFYSNGKEISDRTRADFQKEISYLT